ncbi:LysR family transcriptional regulator [Pelagibius sp. Alg239-R121]|uniref:LysR family transcriptional regulator n=1 Tax=Pelagibius sp. Alg239-R121 TaxID=2993448 RepID=UPI0024A75B66|nr:LysR family transcriptional regulator [Pelagibius sp. Alg239-R121]
MSAQFESDLLRSFVAIVDAGSFTKAAEKIGRTQSAVSMQMRRLEEAAGQPLLLRGSGVVRPSPSGEKLLEDARLIVAHLERANANFSQKPLHGQVRVGLLAEYGITHLPDILGRFAETNPRVEVNVTCAHSGVLCSALKEGKLDLAIVLNNPQKKEGSVLMRDPTFWATSKHHSAHKQKVLPVALFGEGCWWRDWAIQSLQQMNRQYRTAYTSDSNINLRAAVSAGLAVGLLTKEMLPDDCRPLLSREGFPKSIDSTVALRKGRKASSRVVTEMERAIKAAFK